MHNARALKSFKGRLGSIGAGETFHCDPSYLEALKRNKLAESISPRDPGPSHDRSIPSAPGKAAPGNAPSAPVAPETGKGVTSLSAPAVQALRRKTSKELAVGAKKTSKPARKKSKKSAGA